MKKALILAPIIAGALGFAHMGGLETELARAPYVRQSLENIGLRQDRYSSMSPEELVSNVKDWNQAEDYLMKHFSYSLDDLGYPKSSYGNINEIHSAKKGNCSVGATMASMANL